MNIEEIENMRLVQASCGFPGRLECKSGMTSISIEVTQEYLAIIEGLTNEEFKQSYKLCKNIYKQLRSIDYLYSKVGYSPSMFITDWTLRYESSVRQKDEIFCIYKIVADELSYLLG
jgi:hypothetical protein